jgi:pyruvate/2-oxoglutarate dehydrogenase complex dihydrolipoamide dehydrogenase (E3) component
MAGVENYDDLIIGSGIAGKFTAWTRNNGRRTAIVERGLLGGACPNVACLASKNMIWSAKVISLARRGAEFGLKTDSLSADMAAVQRRKRAMVRGLRKIHEDHTEASGADLIYGAARFVATRTVEIELRDGGTRTIQGDRVFLDLGSRPAIPEVPGLAEATPMTHVEALELDRLPRHLIVLGGGYVGLELSQAFRRFGSAVTVIEHGPQLASREDPDIAASLKDLFVDEGIEVALDGETRLVEGHSGDRVRVYVNDVRGERAIEGTDLLVATGRKANTNGIDLDKAGIQLDERGYIKTNDQLETTAQKRLGDGRWRRQSSIHTRRLRRLQRRSRESERGQPQHPQSVDPLLHVHRSGTGPSRSKRGGGRSRRHRVPAHQNADGRSAPDKDGLRVARLHEGTGREEQR